MNDEWIDLQVTPTSLRLAPTLLSGQSFRWHYRKQSDSYLGCVARRVFELREDADTTHFRVVCGGGRQHEENAELLRKQ